MKARKAAAFSLRHARSRGPGPRSASGRERCAQARHAKEMPGTCGVSLSRCDRVDVCFASGSQSAARPALATSDAAFGNALDQISTEERRARLEGCCVRRSGGLRDLERRHEALKQEGFQPSIKASPTHAPRRIKVLLTRLLPKHSILLLRTKVRLLPCRAD